MTFDDIVAHWGTVAKAQRALGHKSRQTLYNWRKHGIPHAKQCRIELMTKRRLVADEDAKRAA